MSITTTESTVHPFERAGLGVAPFRYRHYEFIAGPHGLGSCDLCAACIRHKYFVTGSGEGDKPFKVGCDCIHKIDPELWKEIKAARRAEVDALRRDAAAEARKRLNASAVAAIFAKWPELEACTDPIVVDIVDKIRRFGSVSDRAIDFAVARACRLSDAWQGPLLPPACDVPALEGRVELVGRVLHTKLQDSEYGSQWKMLLAVRCADGEWKAWGTIPSALTDQICQECFADGAAFDARRLRGRVVRIVAAVQVSQQDAGFAFLSRPTVAKPKAPKKASRKARATVAA